MTGPLIKVNELFWLGGRGEIWRNRRTRLGGGLGRSLQALLRIHPSAAHRRAKLKDRQVHGDDEAADQDAEDGHDQRLH